MSQATSIPTAEEAPSLLLNRELSWLEFDARVLAEAFDERNPLLERVKFLSIFSTNLDEFYMVRVAGLRRQVSARVHERSPDGLTAREQLDVIDQRVHDLLVQARWCLHEELLPALEERGVRLLTTDELTAPERFAMEAFFDAEVFPVLTPLAVDPGHPFPYISNLSLSLAVELRDPDKELTHFARVKVPKSLPRWVPVAERPNHFVPLESVIASQLAKLFPGMEIVGSHTFRITRYSDLEIEDTDEPEDLLAMIEESVFRRRFGEVVRLEVQRGMPDSVRQLILDELREGEDPEFEPITVGEVQEPGTLLDIGDLMSIATLDIPELHDAPFVPAVPQELRDPERSIFDVIRERDLLVHHPFDSFTASVEQFIASAARDESVMAIKMTLYRTSGDGAIVRALTEAARRGIQVAVLVELKARFEETNNITWARTLESAGVHVAYGLQGLKTHAKVALVVRKEPDGIRRYVHIGTGNYNSKTARTYTDIGLFTCDEDIGADVSDFFNTLTGFSRQSEYRKLVVAPSGMRQRIVELIQREAGHARAGKPARIVAKMNALVDAETIDALYEASKAGVEIDLILRGICCLRPQLPGTSDRIRVISILGRFLEHTRVWHFANDGAPEFYISSADWMPRNFNSRVECAAPVDEPYWHPRLMGLLETCLADNRQAWELSPNGTYAQRDPGKATEIATHTVLRRDSWGMTRDATPTPSSVAVVPPSVAHPEVRERRSVSAGA
ncbi:MAG TPA: polyphosphate kinase 1 [Gemmatimonadaceae bacterium]|nr:polyphosphate kinase 1 [Gemmatimonadaceae bacterium]